MDSVSPLLLLVFLSFFLWECHRSNMSGDTPFFFSLCVFQGNWIRVCVTSIIQASFLLWMNTCLTLCFLYRLAHFACGSGGYGHESIRLTCVARKLYHLI